jgi:hypothetical protein
MVVDRAARRPTPGNAELRATPRPIFDVNGPGSDSPRPAPNPRDWGVSPFEPLNIRPAEFDRIPVLDRPMMVHADPEPLASADTLAAEPLTAEPLTAEPLTAEPPADSAPSEPAAPSPPRAAPISITGPVAENSDRFASPAAHAPNVAELQRIVTIRVCAPGESLSGRS